MSQFSRRARWLNQIFPASVAPTTKDPGQRSDDVSLVQPYDGGGLGFQNVDTFCRRFAIPIGVSNAINCQVNDENTIMRVYAIDVVQLAGEDANVFMRVTSPAGDSVYVAYDNILGVTTHPRPFVVSTDFRILGPGQTLAAETLGGGAASQFTVGVYGAIAPLGTTFYA